MLAKKVPVWKKLKVLQDWPAVTDDLPDGYNTLVSEGESSLSGGEIRRAELLQLLVIQPTFSMMDEPDLLLHTMVIL